MAIGNSAAITTPGYGSSLPPQVQNNIALSGTGVQTNTFPSTGVLVVNTRSGIVNVKIRNGAGTSPTVVMVAITCYDGTTTELVDAVAPSTAYALGANAVFHKTFRYLNDLTGAAAGGPGASTVNVLTTLGGTSPSAVMDMELCPDA